MDWYTAVKIFMASVSINMGVATGFGVVEAIINGLQ